MPELNQSPRTSGAQLPGAQELFDILAAESPRKAERYDFLKNNTDLFMAYRELGDMAGADNTWIDDYQHLPIEQLVSESTKYNDTLSEYILSHKDDYSKLFDSLSQEDELENADAIFVFGSQSNARIKKAVQLYKDGYAPKLIISGRGPYYAPHLPIEAEVLKRYAMEQGVPADAIITEDRAVTLPDNVKRTLDMFDDMDWHPEKLIIVASTYVLARAKMEWYKFSPYSIKTIAISSDEQNLSEALRRDEWTTSEAGIHMLLNEYQKMIVEHKVDLIRRDNA